MVDCLPQVQICAMRITELEPNGVPDPGTGTMMTIDSLIELGITPSVRDGVQIQEQNGCGDYCLDYQDDDSVQWYDLTIRVCDHNPYVMRLLGQGDVLEDGDVRGYAVPALGKIPSRIVSVEFFAKRINDGVLDTEYPYAWWVLPKVTRLRQDAQTRGNQSTTPQFIGRAFENPNWFDGPLNDWPVTSDRAMQWFPTASLPTTSCLPMDVPVS